MPQIKCSLNIIKLLLLRRKNRPERKASFLFNILGTIAGNFRAVIELTPVKKTKSIKLPVETKDRNISWEQVVTIRLL